MNLAVSVLNLVWKTTLIIFLFTVYFRLLTQKAFILMMKSNVAKLLFNSLAGKFLSLEIGFVTIFDLLTHYFSLIFKLIIKVVFRINNFSAYIKNLIESLFLLGLS